MRKFVLSAAAVMAVFAGFSLPGAASLPATATGTFTILSEDFTFVRAADGNSFFAGSLSILYAGGLTGPATDTESFVVYRDGTFRGHGIEVCSSCTIGGRTGGFTAVFEFSGGPDFTEFAGRLTLIRGTGGLAGLHGGGTFQGTGGVNTYSYRYHLAP